VPGPFDYAYLLLVAVAATTLEHYVFFPRFRRRVERQAPDVRVRAYRRMAFWQWLLSAVAMGAWAYAGRPWSALRLLPPTSVWRLGASVAIVAAVATLVVLQIRGIRRTSSDRLAAARPSIAALAFMLPHTNRERHWFTFLAGTAGICEELIYRGYFVWILSPWLGFAGALVAITIAFGVAHAYQGWKGAVKATLAGGAMALILAVTGWLIPGMVVHALVDFAGGTVSQAVLSASSDAPDEGEGEGGVEGQPSAASAQGTPLVLGIA